MAYTTAAAVAAYMGVPAADDTLTALVDQAAAVIDSYCGRRFTASTETRVYDVPADLRTLGLDCELLTVTTLTNGDGSPIAPTAYTLLPLNGRYRHTIRLKWATTFTYTDSPDGAISVNGTWGYSATPPADVVLANKRLAAWMYRLKDSGLDGAAPLVSPTGAVVMPPSLPRDVTAMLAPYRRTWR